MAAEAFIADLKPAEFTATLTLSRPDHGNKLLADEIRILGRTIRELGSGKDVKVVVVRAQGEAFCLGRDAGPGAAPKNALEIRSVLAEPILDLYADVRATPVPVLAVVQGEARGFGCAMVGVCDLAIAADSARFSMPEMDGHLPPTLAISAVLGKVLPKRLLHLIYTRAQIDAAEALSLGLLSEVVPRAKLAEAASATLARLTDRRRAAICAVKEYLNVAPHTDPVAAARFASSPISVVLASPDGE
jgi:enoyl-CoA hydratase